MDRLPQLISDGIITGGLYALLALGLALIYQVSGVVNFAQGALATLGAYVTWHLTTNTGWLDFWPAVVVTIVVTFVLGVVLQAVLLRPLRRAPAAASFVVTLGLLSVIEAAIGQIWGNGGQFFFLPTSITSLTSLKIGPVFVNGTDLLTLGATAILVVAIFAFLRWTRAGTALRAVSQTTQGARLVGVRVDRVLLTAWGISAAIAAVAGILIVARTGLGPAAADLWLIAAFTGAIIGGLDSLPGAAIGALLIGIVQNLVTGYISTQWHDAIVFLLLLAVLLVRPAGLFGAVVQRRV